MGAELERVNKIAQNIEKRVGIKDNDKAHKIAQVVDEFAGFILQSYLAEKVIKKK